MGLSLRMVLYFFFAGMASQGLVVFDAEAGTVTFRIEDLALIASGIAGYLGTFASSRMAKRKGGAT